MQETQVPSLGREDPPEKEMATRSNTLAWRIPWTEESMRVRRVGHDFPDLACTPSVNRRTREHVRSSSSSERASIFPIRKLIIKSKTAERIK